MVKTEFQNMLLVSGEKFSTSREENNTTHTIESIILPANNYNFPFLVILKFLKSINFSPAIVFNMSTLNTLVTFSFSTISARMEIGYINVCKMYERKSC